MLTGIIGCEKEAPKVAPPPGRGGGRHGGAADHPGDDVVRRPDGELAPGGGGGAGERLSRQDRISGRGTGEAGAGALPDGPEAVPGPGRRRRGGKWTRAKAQLWTAQANLDRIRPLAKLDAASKSDLDNAIGAVQSAQAAVYQAQARLDKADLDLDYTIIRSPVTGISSRSLMREGAYLNPMGASAQLTYVARVDPIWINFSVSQNQMASNQQEIAKRSLVVPKNGAYQVEIELSDGSRYPYTGEISFAEPSFSKETGTFLVRAELPNPESKLRPGMFVKAYVKGAVRPGAIAIPQKAVQETANGHVVYVVGAENKAELRPVMVGEWIGDDWIINQGLKAGEQVIVDGFQRLAPGAAVKAVATAPAPAGGKAEEKTVAAPAPVK